MYNALLDRIETVTKRFRARRMWWMIALVAFGIAFLAYCGIDSARSGQISGLRAALCLGSVAMIGIVVSIVASRRAYRNPRAVATKIEATHPNLNQRLLTALAQKESKSGKPLGYLQATVIREARDHARKHDWRKALPAGKLWTSRIVGMAAAGLMAVTLFALAKTSPESNRTSLAANLPETDLVEVIVEPGNTEIERGTSLAVTARFSIEVPDEADLVCRSVTKEGEENVRRIKMRQNLDDPIVGGFIASVDKKMTYQVITDDWSSEEFSVDVFEFPTLVRSDAGLDYPEYTGMEDKTVEDTVRVSAVEGTKVKWLCYLNKTVATGELVDKEGNRVPLQSDAEHPGAMIAELDLTKTHRYTLELVDDAGRKNKYPPELVARVLPNRPPNLKLSSAKDVSVSPLEEVPLGVEVRDDFGIAQVGLSYTFADQPAKDIVLKEDIERGSKQKIDHLIAMEDLNAEPDQLLSYHFWADDFGPGGELRRTESDMFFAEVRPFEEIYREGEPPAGGQQQQQQQQQQSQNGQQAEKLAELQKEIINATWRVIRDERDDEPSDKFSANVDLLKESQTDAISQLEELMESLEDADSKTHAESARMHMENVLLQLSKAQDGEYVRPMHPAMAAEQAAYGGLLKLRAREFQVTRQQQQQQQGQQSASQRNRQQQIDELEIKKKENQYQEQQQAKANTEEEQQQREVRQVLNRLRELARRQEDLNKQVAELQSALEQAETEEEREEIERQLKRLRDQQQDLLRQTDELAERMQSPENSEEMAEESERMEQTRENVRKASEALENKDAAEALTAGKRAEREFEEMRDEFRQKAAGQFNESVREMRNQAQELDEKQGELAEKMDKIDQQDDAPGLRADNKRDEIQKSLDEQREQLGELLDKMQETVEEAEAAEPLLAQKLYDSYRKTQQQQVDRRLQDTAELLKRGFDNEAKQVEQPAREGITQLREELEEAAKSVLGDEAEALRRALGELDQLSQDLDQEIDENDPTARENRQNRDADKQRQQQQNGQQEGQPNGDSQQQGQRSQNSKNGENTENGEPNDQSSPNQRRENGERQDRSVQPTEQQGGRSGERQQQDSENQAGEQNRSGGSQQQEQADQERQEGQQQSGEQQDQSGEQNQVGQQRQPGQQNQPGQQGQQQQGGQEPQQNGQGQGQRPGEQQQQGQQPGQSSEQGQQNQQGQPQQGQKTGSQPSESGTPQAQQQPGNSSQNGGLSQWAANAPSSQPLTGEGFRDWSDRLREVEEMVEDPKLRSRASQIRDRARQVRIDLKRNSKNPQWRLVEEMIAQPLRELRRDVQEELLRRSAEKNGLVPIDRDPVPDEFADAVRRYYENLGSGR